MTLPKTYFEELTDSIILSACGRIIEENWKDVLAANDAGKTFMDLFDDFFSNAIMKHPDQFIRKLSNEDVLTRMVLESDCDEKRFIPWPDNKNQNRWNPPGKAYLYLSYIDKEKSYNSDLSLGEYVCILECRTPNDTDCCFCRFRPVTKGNVIDLSYNDVSLYKLRHVMIEIQKNLEKASFEKISSELSEGKIKPKERDIKRRIKQITTVKTDIRNVVEEVTTKQLLKILCTSIYKKVDGSEKEKEEAYKSFHVLAKYLEDKKLAGIIYPCTRSNNIEGKNLVLFDRFGAEPIKGSIRKYHYKEF